MVYEEREGRPGNGVEPRRNGITRPRPHGNSLETERPPCHSFLKGVTEKKEKNDGQPYHGPCRVVAQAVGGGRRGSSARDYEVDGRHAHER